MLVVGLTGGISTGKSTVSALLKARDVPIVDADILARSAVAPGTRALAKIVKHFGPTVIREDGTLDRPALGARVFANEDDRRALNAIVHPAVRRAMARAVLGHWMRGAPLCVLDVPLLIEGGLHRFVAKTVVVYCSPELQLQRLMARDRSSHAEASARLSSQLPIAEKLAYADIVLDNSGPPGELAPQVDALLRRLQADAGWSWRVSWLVPPFGILSAVWTLLWRAVARRRKLARRRH